MRYLSVLFGSVFLAVAFAAVALVTSPPEAEAATGGYVGKCGGGKIFLNADERQSFYLHNRARKNHGLKPFCVHPNLQKAARAHSKDMIQRDYFAHGNAGQRLRRHGYSWRRYAENIGRNDTPGSMFNNWMNSSGHRGHILDGRLREIGIGTYTGTFKGMRNSTMYTADFGTR